MLERHKLLMGRTQDRAGQNNGSIGVFWRSFNGIIGHIRYMFRGLKITHNHEHSSLYKYMYRQIYGMWMREIARVDLVQNADLSPTGLNAHDCG